MSKLFSIYGASDDLIETEGVSGCDEYGAYNVESTTFILNSPSTGASMKLVTRYNINGTWSTSIDMIDEDIPIPNWPIEISMAPRGYSTLVEITVPDDTHLVKLDA